MELELGFKFSKTLDEYSSADLRISKDQAGPVFISRETDTMFVLDAHLKGYKKEHVKIEINEDGTRIAISGERPVQEMVMVKWQMHKKEPEIRGFRKAFNIPEGVNLDKIEARFNEEESVLTISMPKLVKGIRGSKIKEINEEDLMPKENHNLEKNSDDIVSEISPSKEEDNGKQVVDEAKNLVSEEIREQVVEEGKSLVTEEIPPKETKIHELESDKLIEKSNEYQEQEGKDVGEDGEREKGKNVVEQQANEKQDEGEDGVGEKRNDSEQQASEEKQASEERQSDERVPKLCVPMIAGTAFIVSLIVCVMHMIRARK